MQNRREVPTIDAPEANFSREVGLGSTQQADCPDCRIGVRLERLELEPLGRPRVRFEHLLLVVYDRLQRLKGRDQSVGELMRQGLRKYEEGASQYDGLLGGERVEEYGLFAKGHQSPHNIAWPWYSRR